MMTKRFEIDNCSAPTCQTPDKVAKMQEMFDQSRQKTTHHAAH